MNKRHELRDIFYSILGSLNVYFQPPSTCQMKYPCIVYRRSRMSSKYADNLLYKNRIGYTVTVIDANPDSEISEKVGVLPYCCFDRHYTADNLNHDVFTIYY